MAVNRRLLLAGVLVAVSWAAWTAFSPDDARAPGSEADPSSRTQGKKGKALATADKIPVVVSELAIPGPAESFERERSLFAYAQSPDELARIDAQKRLAAEEARKRAEEAAAEAARKAEEDKVRRAADAERARLAAIEAAKQPVIPPKPVPPSFPYQYVGTIGPADARFAILTGPDRAYRFVRAGENIDREFKLEYIAERRLDLSYTDPRFQDQFTQVQRLSDASKPSR